MKRNVISSNVQFGISLSNSGSSLLTNIQGNYIGTDATGTLPLGNTGHGNGLYLLDKQGQPLRNGIQSMDTRAAEVVDGWNQRQLHARVFPFTLQSFWPAQPNALLVWLKQHEPQQYDRIGAILMVKDYIKYRLTGEVTADYTDMSGANLMDVRNRSYSRELMALYDLEAVYDAEKSLARARWRKGPGAIGGCHARCEGFPGGCGRLAIPAKQPANEETDVQERAHDRRGRKQTRASRPQ